MSSHNTLRGRGRSVDSRGCHYIPERLAVLTEQAAEAISILEQDRVFRRRTDDFERYAPGLSRRGESAAISILEVQEEPHRSAMRLANRSRPIPSSPIHGVGYEGHGGFMYGEGPEPVDPSDLVPPEESDRRGWIAVVDSGLVEESARPEWIREPHVRDYSDGPESIADGGASHGTFVTSIIRKVAPEYGVLFSAAPPDHNGTLAPASDDDEFPRPTTELDVLAAIDRLVSGIDVPKHEVKTLNLSLGAPQCDPHDGFLLTLRAAIGLWRQHFGNHALIFAAGGNSDDPSPVYPAAFERVRGVGAGINGGQGDQQVWDEDGDAVVAPSRPWIDDVAPGLKLVGLSGSNDLDVVWWSGSSFASAVATALYARGASFEVNDGVVYWQDTSTAYGSIPGLQYA